MKVRVPARAPLGPPETGASMKEPREEVWTAEPTWREVLTSMVEHSMKSFSLGPVGAERSPELGLVKASRTWGPLGSMVMMISCCDVLVTLFILHSL